MSVSTLPWNPFYNWLILCCVYIKKWSLFPEHLQTLCCLTSGPGRLEGEVNVLLVGSADPRHILKTLAGLQDTESLHVSCKKQFLSVCERSNYEASMLISAFLQVWVVESSMEVTARQLLLLYLALMPQESMGNNGVCDLVNRLTYMNTSNRKYQWS